MKKNNILILCAVVVSVLILCYFINKKWNNENSDKVRGTSSCPTGNSAMMGVCKKAFYAYADAEYRHYQTTSQLLNIAVHDSGQVPDNYTNALYHLSLQFSILAELINQNESQNNITKIINEILQEIQTFSGMSPSPTVQKIINANKPLATILSELNNDLRSPTYRLTHLWSQ